MFVGRKQELALLASRLEDVRTGAPRVVIVEAEAGLGKTALVREFLGSLEGARVLRAAGDEDETDIAGGLLDQLLRAAGGAASVPVGGALEPVSAGGALLDAIGLAGDAPIVMVCEDAHWADTPSLRAISFALRRLHAERLLAIVTTRPDETDRLPEGVVRLASDGTGDRIVLAGLGTADVRELARSLGAGDLSVREAERLREHTAGSPLHVGTLVRELGADGLRGPSGSPLPVPRSLQPLVLAQLHRLSPDARDVVVAAAILGLRANVAEVADVADAREPLSALEEVTRMGFLLTEGAGPMQTVSFAHPLVRAAVYHDLGPARRTELHARAAAVSTDPVAALRHREAAAIGPDADLAEAFVALGEQRIKLGDMSQAARAFGSARRLHPDRARRERLAVDAAATHEIAGEMAEALAIADEAQDYEPGPGRDYLLAHRLALSQNSEDCIATLNHAWRTCDPASDPRLATFIAMRAGSNLGMHQQLVDEVEVWARRALDNDPSGEISGNAVFTLALALGQHGHYHRGIDVINEVRARDGVSPLARDRWLAARGTLKLWGDDIRGAREDLANAVDVLRRHGPTHSWITALNPLIEAEYRLGRWDDAIARAELAVSAIDDLEYVWLSPYIRCVSLWAYASRGDFDRAETLLAEAKAAHDRIGGELNISWITHSEAHLAAARGDHERVLRGIAPTLALDNDLAWADPGIQLWRDLQVEALIHLGRFDEAEDVTHRLARAGAERQVPSTVTSAARVRGVLEAARGNDEAARDAFERALEAAAPEQPFRRALVHHAYGAFLRRAGQRREAQTQLTAARETFDALGAAPSLERVNRELAGTGLAPQRRRAKEPTKLTPQESAVVHLARGGYTNKEIGSELVISVRTVEYHLKNAYLKLGVSSRRDLIRAGAEPG